MRSATAPQAKTVKRRARSCGESVAVEMRWERVSALFDVEVELVELVEFEVEAAVVFRLEPPTPRLG